MRNIGKRFYLLALPQFPPNNFCSSQQSWQLVLPYAQYAKYRVLRGMHSTAARRADAWAGKWRYALLRLSRGQRLGEGRLELEREALEGLANQLCT